MREQLIKDSWKLNAAPWNKLIEENALESRRLVTNQAISDAVTQTTPKQVLDIGCGEGWLCRALHDRGVICTGIDFVPDLIIEAVKKKGAMYLLASYEEIASGGILLPFSYDTIVINFALIGEESANKLVHYLPKLLRDGGSLVIQTLHSYSRQQAGDDISGWKQGSWDGLGDSFVKPYEWYYRTLVDWQHLFSSAGFKNLEIIEPKHPVSGVPMSYIFRMKK